MPYRVFSFLYLFLFSATFACAGPESELPVLMDVDAVLEKHSADGSGFVILLEVDGLLVFSKGYGYADRAPQRRFTPKTVAQIGSITKQFTATAVLQLAEAGKIDLDAPIADYLPSIAVHARTATIHQILTHSAGFPGYCGSDFTRFSKADMLEKCLAEPLQFEPGAQYAYSNAGYAVLGMAIEAVTGESLENHIKNNVLRPNGLNRTGYHFPVEPESGLAHGYRNGEDRGVISDRIAEMGEDWWNLKGNGGIQASSLDMYAWYKALNGRAGVLSPWVREQLTKPHTPWKDGVAEGYGWFFRDDGTDMVRQMSHSGSDGVFFSYYWHRPEEKLFLYFVGNSGEEPSVEALRKILDILRDHFITPTED